MYNIVYTGLQIHVHCAVSKLVRTRLVDFGTLVSVLRQILRLSFLCLVSVSFLSFESLVLGWGLEHSGLGLVPWSWDS